MKKTLIAALICSASVVGVSAGTAFAGEVTGSGKGGPNGDGTPGGIGKARSACVYSGLEDEPREPGTVQNWGHVDDDPVFVEIIESKGASYVVAMVDFGGGPTEATLGCNPHVGGE